MFRLARVILRLKNDVNARKGWCAWSQWRIEISFYKRLNKNFVLCIEMILKISGGCKRQKLEVRLWCTYAKLTGFSRNIDTVTVLSAWLPELYWYKFLVWCPNVNIVNSDVNPSLRSCKSSCVCAYFLAWWWPARAETCSGIITGTYLIVYCIILF